MRRLLFVVLLLGVLLAAAPARANSAAPFSRPTGAVPGVVVERPSPVVVEREDLAIECSSESAAIHPKCTFVATYALFNPTAAEEELVGAFYSAGSEGVFAVQAGVAVGAVLTDEQRARLDAIVGADPEIAAAASNAALRADGFHIVVAAGARAPLVFRGTLLPLRFLHADPRGGYAFPAIQTRHPVLASSSADAWVTTEEEFLYLLSPIRRWAGDPEIHVTIRRDRGSTLDARSPAAGWRESQDGAVTTDSATVRASSGQNLRFTLGHRAALLKNGGPLVGIGPRIGREELRVRFGYEIGIANAMILAASAETNGGEYLTAAATLDVATPDVLVVIPSLGIGAGIPVQLRRGADPRVGVRAQITIALPLLSFVFPIDVYPAGSSSGSHVEGAFLTQLSF